MSTKAEDLLRALQSRLARVETMMGMDDSEEDIPSFGDLGNVDMDSLPVNQMPDVIDEGDAEQVAGKTSGRTIARTDSGLLQLYKFGTLGVNDSFKAPYYTKRGDTRVIAWHWLAMADCKPGAGTKLKTINFIDSLRGTYSAPNLTLEAKTHRYRILNGTINVDTTPHWMSTGPIAI